MMMNLEAQEAQRVQVCAVQDEECLRGHMAPDTNGWKKARLVHLTGLAQTGHELLQQDFPLLHTLRMTAHILPSMIFPHLLQQLAR
jgi:hypothetical protein